MKTCVLIDGHSEAYRAFYAMSRSGLAVRATGEPTGAVFGFLRQLLLILRQRQPDFLVVAFDPGHTFREDLFASYKATRDRMPDELYRQIERIQQILDAMHICHLTVEGYEADDVIGTLAAQGQAAGMQVLVKTGDRDLFQLATDHVRVLYTSPRGEQEYDTQAVQARFGVAAGQFTEMKALQGDSSDNIPGVPGVGEKSAAKLLQQFGSIQQLFDRIDEVKGPKLRQNLLAHQDQVAVNLKLVQIVQDMNITLDWETTRPYHPDRRAVTQLLRDLDLNAILETFNEQFLQTDLFTTPLMDDGETLAAARMRRTSGYRCIQNRVDLEDLVTQLASAEVLAFDFETNSTDPMTAEAVGLALSWAEGQAAYLPVGHRHGVQLDWADIGLALKPFLTDTQRIRVAHNAKFDLLIARRLGLEPAEPIHDSMIMAWVMDPGRRRIGLKDLALQELGCSMQPLKDLIGSGRAQITMGEVAIEQAAAYASDDAAQTWALYVHFRALLQDQDLWSLYLTMEQPLIRLLADVETRGIMLDKDYLLDLQQEFAQRLSALTQRIYSLVGHEFNLRSPQQLGQALFSDQGLKLPATGIKRTKAGGYSTAAGVLEDLALRVKGLDEHQNDALQAILAYRRLHKLQSTYVDALLAQLPKDSARVHTSFNQAGAATGRMSSNNPNLQNIPIRTEEGRRLRRAFVAPAGCVLVTADYSQIELRVLAHVSGDRRLVQAFEDDQDIHAITAAELFAVPLTDVSQEQRSLAKTINFATIYGVSAFGLSSRTDMSRTEADEFLDRYFMTYPKVDRYLQETRELATTHGYVETLTGRKRMFPELQNPSLPKQQRHAIERAAINAPIQGGAADIIKVAMINLEHELAARGLQSMLILQVHDELVLEVPDTEKDTVGALTRQTMESAFQLKVPLKVDVKIGTNWRDLLPVAA